MKKTLINIFCFPVLFVYFVGKLIAGSVGIKNNPAVPTVFTLLVLLGIGGAVYSMIVPKEPELVVPEGENPGVYFIPSDDTNSVMSVTMLESALMQFHASRQRLPKDFAELRDAGIISNLPEPKPGFKYQLDLQWPVIIEVPTNTPPLRQATDIEPETEADKPALK
jgi:hypothetical protein